MAPKNRRERDGKRDAKGREKRRKRTGREARKKMGRETRKAGGRALSRILFGARRAGRQLRSSVKRISEILQPVDADTCEPPPPPVPSRTRK